MSDEQKTANESEREKAVKEAEAKNAELGEKVGPRFKVGATRGKNPTVITYLAFDDALPKTLPTSVQQFMETVTSKESELIDFLIRGYNDASYEAASDPLAEYVVASWDPQVQSTFRIAVRNYFKGLGLASLEDAVAIIRPGFVAKFGDH